MAAVAVKAAVAKSSNKHKKNKVTKNNASISPEDDEEDADEQEQVVLHEGFWKYQPHFARFYKDVRVEVFVAGLIAANFITNIVEKQIWPSGDPNVDGGNGFQQTFASFELFYNIAFTIELMVNMYAFWLYTFWNSGWNIFDFVVVMIGLLDTANAPLPGPLSMLRMMRAFRVFRLFKRVKSLNKIIVSLAKAVPGVMNAFFIMLLVMCIFAILAVDLFRDVGKAGDISFDIGDTFDDFKTVRGGWYGQEYFGNFFRSLYTLFQVLTGESWSEAIARPLLEGWSPVGAGIFFVTFILLNAVVLINVVVAVLLEKMVDDEEEEIDDGEEGEEGDAAIILAKAAKANTATQMADMREEMAKLQATMALLIERLETTTAITSQPQEPMEAISPPSEAISPPSEEPIQAAPPPSEGPAE